MAEEPEQGAAELAVHDDASERAVVADAKSAPADRETGGPFDLGEVPGMRPYVDLGGIKIAPREGLQMRLEIDERAQRVVAVTLDYLDSVLQLQAFSAPKSTGLWHEVRHEIAQQLSAQGAEAREEFGEFGPELVTMSAVPAEQGGGTRVARFIGVDGPRWLLRGVVMGRATVDADARTGINQLFREVVVVRGDQPMPPSELLPLTMPSGVPQGGPAQA